MRALPLSVILLLVFCISLSLAKLFDVEQWRRFGGVRLIARYSVDYVRGLARTRSHWKAYRAVRTEVEARAAARLVIGLD